MQQSFSQHWYVHRESINELAVPDDGESGRLMSMLMGLMQRAGVTVTKHLMQ